MAIEKIKYKNKVAIKNDESLPEINKVTDENMNEIKKVINNNADELSLIKNQIPTGQATGNPIHIADSTNLEAKLRLNGGSKQETRSNNLYNPETNVAGYLNQAGEIISNNNWVITDYIPVLEALDYYIAGNKNLTDGDGVYGAYYNADKELISTFPYSTYKTETTTITTPENCAYIKFSIYKYQDNTKTFDFYTNAPTPNYQSKVETVGSNVNLFDKDNANILTKLYIDNANMKIATTSENTNIIIFTCKKNKDYTISRGAGTQFRIATTTDMPANNVAINNTLANHTGTEISITTGENDNYIVIYIGTNDLTEVLNSLKIEEGDKATAYSPYGMGSVEINVRNKNWFVPTLYSNNTKIKQTNAVVTLEKDTFIFECIDGDMYFGDIVSKGSKYTENIGNLIPIYDTSILSVKVINEKFAKNFLTCFDENLISLGYKQFNSSNILNNYSLPEGTKYVTLRFGMSPSMATIGETYKTQVQIEAGELTEYEKYQSQTKIMYTQQEMLEGDYIEDVEHHGWGKYVFTGDETFWEQSNTIENTFKIGCTFLKDSLGYENTETAEVLCSRFKVVSAQEQSAGEKNTLIVNNGKGFIFLIDSNIANSVNEFKLKLAEWYQAGEPLIVYYKLATPIDLELTEEQKEAKKINTYKNVTNIVADNSLATLDVAYKKDQETLNKSYEDRIAALEAAILS